MPRTEESTATGFKSNRFRPEIEHLEARETPAIIAVPDFYSMTSGMVLTTTNLAPAPTTYTATMPSRGVLGNDYNNALTPSPQYLKGLTARLVSGPVDASTGLPLATPFQFNNNGAGSFSFTAPQNFSGKVTFSYQASDGAGNSSAVTKATITVKRSIHRVAAGADEGGSPRVSVYNSSGSLLLYSFMAYDSSFTGGVRVAVGDFNGDGVDDIVTVPGPGGAPNIRIFDGRTGTLLQSFYGLDPSFTGGTNIATGDINGDARMDIILGADQGGGPRVTVLDGSTLTTLTSFYAYDPGFTGGVRVAAGDVSGNGIMSILTAPGFGGAPNVRQFDYSNNAGTIALARSFFAGDPNDSNGLYITSGDFNGDLTADFALGSGAGIPILRVYSGLDLTLISIRNYGPTQQLATSTQPTSSVSTSGLLAGVTTGLAASPSSLANASVATAPGSSQGYSGGLRVGTTVDRTGLYANLITAGGPNSNSEIKILSGSTNNSTLFQTTLADNLVFGGTFYGGLFVAGHQ